MGKKNLWQKLLDKLVAVNEKEYGNEVPDCCGNGGTIDKSNQSYEQNKGA